MVIYGEVGLSNVYQLGIAGDGYAFVKFRKLLEGNFEKADVNGGFILGGGVSIVINEDGIAYGVGTNNSKQLLLEKNSDYNRVLIIEESGFRIIE